MRRRALPFLLVLCFAAPAGALDPQVQQTLDTQTSQVSAKYGTKDAVSTNISAPATSSAKPFTTLDDSQSFVAPLACPSSASFLELTAYSSSTGDLAVIVKQQTDLAAAPPATGFNNYFTVPVKVTYACLNGFISCDPGTVSNCVNYAWTVDAALKLGIRPAGTNELGGCFCINKSCGPNLFFTNQERVLSALGGGVVATIQAGYPQLAISRPAVTGSSIAYYGLAAQNCQSAPGGSGTNTPLKYSANPAAMADDAAKINASNNEFYAEMAAIQAQTTGTAQLRQCVNRWEWKVATRTLAATKSGSGSMCAVYDVFAAMPHTSGTAIYSVQMSATTFSGYPGCPSVTPLTVGTFDMEAYTLALPSDAISPAQFKSATLNAWFDHPDCPPGNGQVNGLNTTLAIALCGTPGMHNGGYSWNATLEYMYDAVSDTLVDGCAAFANDPACTLKDETEVDALGAGVRSWREYNPTGLNIKASTATTTTAIGTYTKSRNWWRKERTYLCKGAGQGYNFSYMLKRSATITDSVQGYKGTSSQTYADYVCDPTAASCSVVALAGTVTVNAADMVKGTLCTPSCKVTVPMPATNAVRAGNQSQYLLDNTNTAIFQYRLCQKGGIECPLDASKGETAVPDPSGKTCYCSSEFPMVASTLTALSTAARSMICSSGNKCSAGQKWDATQGKCI